jgi:hypothetical protein
MVNLSTQYFGRLGSIIRVMYLLWGVFYERGLTVGLSYIVLL